MPLDAVPHHGEPGRRYPLIVRLPDWSRRLLDFVEQNRELPLAWGERDGVVFAARAVAAMVGYEIWRPTWTDQAGVKAAVAAEGGISEAWTRRLGPPVYDWHALRCGDVALMPVARGSITAVAFGDTWLCAPTPCSLALFPRDQAFIGWHVG